MFMIKPNHFNYKTNRIVVFCLYVIIYNLYQNLYIHKIYLSTIVGIQLSIIPTYLYIYIFFFGGGGN